MNMLRPISPQVRPGRARVPQGARHARRDDRRPLRVRREPAAPARPAYDATRTPRGRRRGVKNGTNLASVLSIMEMCWGDVGLLLSMPRQGLGNSAIASVADDEQLERFDGIWAAMAITEPGTGSDSANIRTTAVLDGDEYVLNGEKIYVTSGERCRRASSSGRPSTRALGRAAIKSFVVPKGTPGMTRRAARAQARHPRLRHRGDPLRGLPGAGGEPARLARRRPQAGLRRRDGDLRQHPSAGRRDGGRLRPARRST